MVSCSKRFRMQRYEATDLSIILQRFFSKEPIGYCWSTKMCFQGNGWGLKIQANCMDNVITENNFTGNTFDVSTNGSLVLNTFNNNYWDKYEGYDLDKNGIGDIPFHPLSLYSVIIENNPIAMLLYRSFMVTYWSEQKSSSRVSLPKISGMTDLF
jgi:nitrous oxidase accessory protein NosD